MTAQPRRHVIERTPLRPLVLFAVGLFLLIGLAIAVAYLMTVVFLGQRAAEERGQALRAVSAPSVPPGPRLQTHAPRDLAAYEQAEDEVLTSYGWVDRGSGRVRIPIQRAMQLLAERGLPKAGPPPEETPR